MDFANENSLTNLYPTPQQPTALPSERFEVDENTIDAHKFVTGRESDDANNTTPPKPAESGPKYDLRPTITNYNEVEIEDNGKVKIIKEAEPISEIADKIAELTDNWPRRLDTMLFIDDGSGPVFFDSKGEAALFGWLDNFAKVRWGQGESLRTKAELHAELRRIVQRYRAIESVPHEPKLNDVYYACQFPEAGDGGKLNELIDRFCPETDTDRDLILAAILTAFWGGPPGFRPMFVITSDDGRGVGKSTLVQIISKLVGGHLEVTQNEDIQDVKTRMLSPGARLTRLCLVDNIKTMRLSWAELEAMVTADIISGRQMYMGEGQRPNLMTWFLTLNGVSLSTDVAQRSVIIKLRKPERQGSWSEDTITFVNENRQAIIGDVIAHLRGTLSDPYTFAKHTRWTTWERDVLSKVLEPAEAQRVISERQVSADVEEEEVAILEDFVRSKLAEEMREDFGINGETDFSIVDEYAYAIPVQQFAVWYRDATGDKGARTASVTRKIEQWESEGQSLRLAKGKSRAVGRHIVWKGKDAGPDALINKELMTRAKPKVDNWSR